MIFYIMTDLTFFILVNLHRIMYVYSLGIIFMLVKLLQCIILYINTRDEQSTRRAFVHSRRKYIIFKTAVYSRRPCYYLYRHWPTNLWFHTPFYFVIIYYWIFFSIFHRHPILSPTYSSQTRTGVRAKNHGRIRRGIYYASWISGTTLPEKKPTPHSAERVCVHPSV